MTFLRLSHVSVCGLEQTGRGFIMVHHCSSFPLQGTVSLNQASYLLWRHSLWTYGYRSILIAPQHALRSSKWSTKYRSICSLRTLTHTQISQIPSVAGCINFSPHLWCLDPLVPTIPSVWEGFPPLIPVDTQFSQQTSQVSRHLISYSFYHLVRQTFPSIQGYLEDINMIWVWINTYENTIFRGMTIHAPAILMFTRGTRFWHTAIQDL